MGGRGCSPVCAQPPAPHADEGSIRGLADSVLRDCEARLPQGPGGPGFPKASDDGGVEPTSLLVGRDYPAARVKDMLSDGPCVFAILHTAGCVRGTSWTPFQVLRVGLPPAACGTGRGRGPGLCAHHKNPATGLRPTRNPTSWRDGVDSPGPK